MLPDLNRLKIFGHVYLNKSVSSAARELHITQPAVSQQLKKLERELKIPLFTRTNKRMIPTPAASRLYQRIAPFISELQKEIQYLRRPLDTPYGQLRIGASPAFGRQFLPIIFNHFRFRFPTVTFTAELENRDVLLAKVSTGEIDLAIVSHPVESRQEKKNIALLYTCENLADEQYVLACSHNYYQRKIGSKMDYKTISNLDFLATEAVDPPLTSWFRHHFKKIPYELNYVLLSADLPTIIAGIRCGMGAGILPLHMVKKESENGSIRIVNHEKKQLANRLSLIQLKNKETTLTEKAFTVFFKKEMAQLFSR